MRVRLKRSALARGGGWALHGWGGLAGMRPFRRVELRLCHLLRTQRRLLEVQRSRYDQIIGEWRAEALRIRRLPDGHFKRARIAECLQMIDHPPDHWRVFMDDDEIWGGVETEIGFEVYWEAGDAYNRVRELNATANRIDKDLEECRAAFRRTKRFFRLVRASGKRQAVLRRVLKHLSAYGDDI